MKKYENSGKLLVYTDGCCEPNPGRGGWSYVVKKNGGYDIVWGSVEFTTNNRMELIAMLKALYFLDKLPSKVPAIIYSDSTYCVNGANEWMHSWAKGGWKKNIKNTDLWKDIYDVFNRNHQIRVSWIRGHNGNEGNELADKYATIASFHQWSGNESVKSL